MAKYVEFYSFTRSNTHNTLAAQQIRAHYKCFKEFEFEVCPKYATKSYSEYDRKWVNVQDQPIRGAGIRLQVLKRRFRCPGCMKVFTEPLHCVRKGFKAAERYCRRAKWGAENFADLKRVQRAVIDMGDPFKNFV